MTALRINLLRRLAPRSRIRIITKPGKRSKSAMAIACEGPFVRESNIQLLARGPVRSFDGLAIQLEIEIRTEIRRAIVEFIKVKKGILR